MTFNEIQAEALDAHTGQIQALQLVVTAMFSIEMSPENKHNLRGEIIRLKHRSTLSDPTVRKNFDEVVKEFESLLS